MGFMELTKADVELLKQERARLRDWNCEFGEDLPTTKAMNILRIRDINNLLKAQA
jgi:hypothetical protein